MTGPPTSQKIALRRPFLATIATGGLGTLVGCTSNGNSKGMNGSTTPTDTDTPSSACSPLEVLHNGTSGPNQLAIESFTGAFRDAYPEVSSDVRPGEDIGVDDLLMRRIAGGDPPGVFGTVPGGGGTWHRLTVRWRPSKTLESANRVSGKRVREDNLLS